MDLTGVMINLIDKVQALYEWFVRIFGHVVHLIEKVKEIVLDFIEFIKDAVSSEEDLQAFLKNYSDNEHYFI
jgi:phage-related minor tail protein